MWIAYWYSYRKVNTAWLEYAVNGDSENLNALRDQIQLVWVEQ